MSSTPGLQDEGFIRIARSRSRCSIVAWSSETEDKRECFIDGPQLVGIETPGGSPQALGIDDRGLLDKDPGFGVIQ